MPVTKIYNNPKTHKNLVFNINIFPSIKYIKKISFYRAQAQSTSLNETQSLNGLKMISITAGNREKPAYPASHIVSSWFVGTSLPPPHPSLHPTPPQKKWWGGIELNGHEKLKSQTLQFTNFRTLLYFMWNNRSLQAGLFRVQTAVRARFSAHVHTCPKQAKTSGFYKFYSIFHL